MKRILIGFLIFLIVINSSFSLKAYNSSLGEIALDQKGWCPQTPITFKVYNKTQFLDKGYILDNLCGINETPVKNKCSVFSVIRPNVRINTGPLSSMPILFKGNPDANGEFNITFNKTGDYYIEMDGVAGFNDYRGDRIRIVKCRISTKINTGVQSGITKNNRKVKNSTIFLSNSRAILENSKISNKTDLKVISLGKKKIKKLTTLNNSFITILVNSSYKNFTKFKLIYFLNIENLKETKVFFYDEKNSKWLEEKDVEFKTNSITFLKAKFGIYSLTKPMERPILILNSTKENKPENTSLLETNSNLKINKTDLLGLGNNQNINARTSIKDKIKPFLLPGGIGILFLVLILFGVKMMKSMKIKKEIKKIEDEKKIKLQEEVKKKKVLEEASKVFDNTRNYVIETKNRFDKDKIYRVLVEHGVSKEIIDKVFDEFY